MTDKKVEEYLERARKISKSEYGTSTPEMVIAIAKMIQLEEHRNISKQVAQQELDEMLYKLSRE